MKSIYLVWCPERGETRERNARRITGALDPADAAELWAEQDDYRSAEYSIVGGREQPVVHVCEAVADWDALDAPVMIFRIEGEAVPSYTAHEVLPP